MPIDDLKAFGLSENESRVYLAALQLGPSSALEIARESNVKRPTAYLALEDLQKQGFIYIEFIGLKRKFVAASPEKIEEKINALKNRYYDALPELLGMYKLKGSASFVKYYEGLEGLKSLYESILREIRSGDPYYIITKQENWYKLDAKWFENFVERRSKRNLDTRILFQESVRAQHNKTLQSALKQHVKILPRSVSFTSDVIICPQRYVVHSLIEPIAAISIENPDIINTQLEIFRALWESASEQ